MTKLESLRLPDDDYFDLMKHVTNLRSLTTFVHAGSTWNTDCINQLSCLTHLRVKIPPIMTSMKLPSVPCLKKLDLWVLLTSTALLDACMLTSVTSLDICPLSWVYVSMAVVMVVPGHGGNCHDYHGGDGEVMSNSTLC